MMEGGKEVNSAKEKKKEKKKKRKNASRLNRRWSREGHSNNKPCILGGSSANESRVCKTAIVSDFCSKSNIFWSSLFEQVHLVLGGSII